MFSNGPQKDKNHQWCPNPLPDKKSALFEDDGIKNFADGLRLKAKTPNMLLPEKK